MIPSEDSYHSEKQRLEFRRNAVRVWWISLLAVSLWTALILAAPLAVLGGYKGLGTPLYTFFSYLCHQIPARTFHLAGEPFGVCTRCFGVYLGIVLGFAAYPLWRDIAEAEPPARFWLFLSLVPIGIDWSLTVLGIWENTAVSRAVTGLILGFACATFIIPAIIDISRNLGRSSRRENAILR
jgi:uncharacterized membrane protein